MNPSLKKALIDSLSEIEVDDIMEVEFCEDHVECCQISRERLAFEAAVQKLADLWRPIVKDKGLHIRHGRAGIRFIDCNRLGIYFSMEDAKRASVAPNMHQHILAQEKAPIAGRLSQKIAPKKANKIVPLSAMLILPFLALAWVDPIWDVAITEGISCGMATDGTVIINGAETATGYVKIPEYVYVPFYGNGPVGHIGNNAFFCDGKLKGIEIPNCVSSIGNTAFYQCGSLETVIFPSGYAAIVFDSNLNSWISTDYLWRKESDGVTSLGKNLFVGCSKIKDITISQCICSSRLSTIFPDAFETIENVIITPGTTVIGDYTFRGCRSLKKIFIPRVLTPSRYSTITKIGDFAFDGCASLTDIVLPDSITDIGVDVFKNCTGLKSVTLSASLNDIPVCTFYGCTNLANVAIPNGVIEIHDGAFYGCALATVTLPGSVTDVASGAFGGCSELRSIVASSDNPKYSSDHGLLLTKDGRTLVAGVNGDVVIPDGVTRIGGNAFFNLQKLMSVTIPASVTHIESSAFRGCSGLTNIVFKGDAPSVGGSVFLGVSQDCRVVIDRSSNCWGGLVPCRWNGLLITYPWYNITLYSEGGQCAEHSRIVDHGSVIGDLPEPTKVGFSFDGWYSESHGGDKIYSSDLVLSDLDVYAQWLPNKYSVSFDANGGVGGVTNELDYASRIVVPDVTREGYTLAGWSPEIDETVPASNAIYTAKWQINQYTVTFDANGGDGGMSVLQDYGADIVVPEVCKTECVFNGWLPIVEDTVPASNVTYTAQWRVNQYAVVFDADGGVGGITNTQEYASKIVPPNVSREGYTFVGWSPEVDATMPASNVTYTVLWRINEYAIAFDANGGIGSVTNEQDYATEIVTPDVSREGFTFMGWSPEVDATVPASNVTYMAQWKLNEYTVSLFVCDGEDGSPLVVEYGAKVSDIALPTRDGYVFGGWYDKPEDGKLVDGDTLIVGDMSLYAKWNSIYTVVFDANGGEGVMPDQPFVYGEEQSLSNIVFKATDRRFAGWATEKDGIVEYDDGEVVSNLTEIANGVVTLFAAWEVWTDDMQVCDDVFGGDGVVSLDENDNIVVTLTNDVSGTVEIPDNVGAVTIDLNGHDMVGDGGPAIRIVKGDGDGGATRLAIVDTSEGEKGQIFGGGESAGIEVAEDAATGVKLDVEEGVGVFNGDGSEQELKPKLVGTGKVTVPKSWKTGQKVTWKATADKGSVFARWEGPLVDSLNITKNERRNPSLAFAVPEGFETNQIKAVFIPLDDDGLYALGITQTEFEPKEAVSDVRVTDDSQSYVTASASGLPTGLKFDAKKMAITGTPTKSGVYWVQIKARNASGYQWAENVRVTVSGGGTEAKEPKLTRTAYYPLTVICANDGGTVSGTGVYAEGKKVSVKATPAKGCVFAGWHETANSEKGTVSGVGGADYRSASLNVTVPETRYVFALFATKEDDADSLKVAVEDVTTEPDGTIGTIGTDGTRALDMGACVSSLSLPKLAVSGLPTGLKYDTKSLKISGKATKPGVYTVTVKATNAAVAKATDASTTTFKITVPNFECAALPRLKPETDAYGIVRSGVKFDDGLVDCTPADGWTVKVAGLPSGLKWDAKIGKIVGVPTAKAGSYTVTFTASKKGEAKQVATITLNVESLPDWVVGTFDGSEISSGAFGDRALPCGLVKMTVAANGKISGKVIDADGTWALSAAAFDSVEGPVSNVEELVFHATVIGKSGKMAITNEVEIAAEEVAARPESAPYLRGALTARSVTAPYQGLEPGVEWCAWQNLWKTEPWKTDAKAFAKAKPVEIAQSVPPVLSVPFASGIITLKFAATGAVTASGKFVTGQDASGRDIVYSASCSSVLIPDGDGVRGAPALPDALDFRVFLYFVPKAGKFDGYSDEVPLVWDGADFSVK